MPAIGLNERKGPALRLNLYDAFDTRDLDRFLLDGTDAPLNCIISRGP